VAHAKPASIVAASAKVFRFVRNARVCAERAVFISVVIVEKNRFIMEVSHLLTIACRRGVRQPAAPDFQGGIDAGQKNVRAVVAAGADHVVVIADLGRLWGAQGEWARKCVRV
jgi:hypothetical protein